MIDEAELERLAHLVGECAEVQKEAMKIVRHGWIGTDPTNGRVYDNGEMLRNEIINLMGTLSRMAYEGDIFFSDIKLVSGSILDANPYMRYQPKIVKE